MVAGFRGLEEERLKGSPSKVEASNFDRGKLRVVGWHGVVTYDVEIVGATATTLRVTCATDMRLPRGRVVGAGGETRVPRIAVVLEGGGQSAASGWSGGP